MRYPLHGMKPRNGLRSWIVLAVLMLIVPSMPAHSFTLEQLDQLKKDADTRARNARETDLEMASFQVTGASGSSTA